MISKEDKQTYNKVYGVKNKEAISANKKKYAANNKEKIRTYRKKYYEENKPEFIASQRAYYATDMGRRVKICAKAKERAKASGLEFSITINDIPLPEFCPYLGIKLTHDLGEGQKQSNSSIDRIDNDKGYIPGNVRIISRLANSMKTSSTREHREAFARAVLNNPTL